MPSLGEIQAGFLRAVFDADARDAAAAVTGDGVAAEARVAIYRHHVFTSLTGALQAIYPVINRLVGEGFFAYAAHEFIRRHPPTGPCLHEYGEALPGFLDAFEPCRELGYLPDVARLEWALNAALHADDTAPLDLAALRALDPAHAGAVTFRLDPSVTLLASPWPVDRIWRANQPDADPDATIDAAGGGARLEIRRLGDDVVFRRLEPAAFAFRRSLLDGEPLATAARHAGEENTAFDLTGALQALFEENVVTEFGLTSRTEEPA
jgi:hypothetical protein